VRPCGVVCLGVVAGEGGNGIELPQILPSHLDDPYLPDGMRGYLRALAFDTHRVSILSGLLEKGLAERVDDENGVPHVVFTLGKLSPGIADDDPRSIEDFFQGALPWHARFRGSAARMNRQVFQSMRDEWRDTGWIRLSMFEI
jgi:hypothetical protein